MEKKLGKPVDNSFENCDDNFEAVLKIIKKQEKHQSILDIRKKIETDQNF